MLRFPIEFKLTTLILSFIIFLTSCDAASGNKNNSNPMTEKMPPEKTNKNIETDTALFGAGCFWCVEAVFQNLKGVILVESGYAGGQTINPDYKDVCTGITGHAEVCRITFNPLEITYDELLSVFWQTHDPTTLNRQGNDVGTQYRSVIFYFNDSQKQKAEKYKSELNKEKAFENPVITEISPSSKFYKAENYHQNYYNLNKEQPYCKFIIGPKIEKMEKIFGTKLKQAR